MPAPIVIFAYNRDEHLKKTIEALEKNDGAAQSDLFIFVDSPVGNKNDRGNEGVKTYLNKVKYSNGFASVKIVNAEEHKGLAKSVITGVSDVITRFGSVIVVEDDLVTSRHFLKYMNKSLEQFKDDMSIWSISGYTLPLKKLEDYKNDIYLSYRASSWGWATWKDRWELNDWEVKDYMQFKKSLLARRRFNRGGNDLSFMLDRQMLGMIDSWAVRWCYNQFKNNMLTVFPSKSLVVNTGCDGSGTHFKGSSTQYDTFLSEQSEFELEKPDLERTILKEFKAHYSEPFFKSFVKEILYQFNLYQIK